MRYRLRAGFSRHGPTWSRGWGVLASRLTLGLALLCSALEAAPAVPQPRSAVGESAERRGGGGGSG